MFQKKWHKSVRLVGSIEFPSVIQILAQIKIVSPYDLSPYIFVTMIICHHSSPVTKCRCHQNFVTECRGTKKMSPYVLDPISYDVLNLGIH